MSLQPSNVPSMKKFHLIAAATDVAFEKRAGSKPQKSVNRACTREAEIIAEIAEKGNLPDKIALEYELQKRDLVKYAQFSGDEKNIKQGLKDMEAGIAAYTDLAERPQLYKEQASRYTDRNKDKRLDVPKDGMRYALASQMTRLQNRNSLQLSSEEKVLLSSRRALVRSIVKDYSRLQEQVIHGGPDDSHSI